MTELRIGVIQLTMAPLDVMLASARAMNEAGMETIWLAEAYPWWRKHGIEARSSTGVAALMGRATKRLTIGWGIIAASTRHPLHAAMDARVVQGAGGPGRFILGFEDLPQQHEDADEEDARATPSDCIAAIEEYRFHAHHARALGANGTNRFGCSARRCYRNSAANVLRLFHANGNGYSFRDLARASALSSRRPGKRPRDLEPRRVP